MKVGNFGSFDPELKARGIVGLTNTSKLDEEIWNEYSKDWERLAYDSEIIQARFLNAPIETSNEIEIPVGKEREVIVRQRINQSFFHSAVLTSYDNRCCITGLSCSDLLEACHIVDWTTDIENRLNPSNGICLNALFHKSYDKNYIGISPDYQVMVSDRLFDENSQNANIRKFFLQYHKTEILLPDRFMPNKELLSVHYQQFITQ